MSGPVPIFAVVGHVNRGKSSVVSTLAADESVVVDDTPGTTRRNRRFPMRVDGEVLYELVDTPGFERARHMLHWLQEHESGTADRQRLVREFVAAHRGSGSFDEECELLRPVLEGAAILYVVDGSIPFNPAAEAETEILRWTGRPRMALINPIGEADHTAEWKAVLDQYFGLVRVFDAHGADFAQRVELLRALRELSEDWRAPIDRAIGVLQRDRDASLRESASLIADTLVDMLSHVEEKRLAPDADPDPHREPLTRRFTEALRTRELELRHALRQVYLHPSLRVDQGSVDRLADEPTDDLFDTATWSRLGLSRPQLVAAGAAAGGLLGGSVDVAVGGASFLAGALFGATAGAFSTWWAWDRLAEVEVLGASLGGRLLRIGPLRTPNFPWVVLDRALLFHDVVAHHAHARRAPVDLADVTGIVTDLSAAQRRPVQAAFDRLQRRPDAAAAERARRELADAIEPLVRLREPGPDRQQ